MEKANDKDINELFMFQNIDSKEYSCLKDIYNECYENGIHLALAKAFFRGIVIGKRIERTRHKNKYTQY